MNCEFALLLVGSECHRVCIWVELADWTMIAAINQILWGDREFDKCSCGRFRVEGLFCTNNKERRVFRFARIIHSGHGRKNSGKGATMCRPGAQWQAMFRPKSCEKRDQWIARNGLTGVRLPKAQAARDSELLSLRSIEHVFRWRRKRTERKDGQHVDLRTVQSDVAIAIT